MDNIEEFFDDREQASAACAQFIADGLKQRLSASQRATFVASGGSTPAECYKRLSLIDLQWKDVDIVPSDDRCVPADHDESNEGMIRRALVTKRAKDARLVALFDDTLPTERLCRSVESKLRSIDQPFAVTLLGVGEDGHFASLFADDPRAQFGLDPDNPESCMLAQTSASSRPRVTLTTSRLLDSDEILLLFFGEIKRDVYEQAKDADSDYPVSRLLNQQRTPVRVVWAP